MYLSASRFSSLGVLMDCWCSGSAAVLSPGSRLSLRLRLRFGRDTSHVSRASVARPGTQSDVSRRSLATSLCDGVSGTAGLRREPLIALAAVEQMPAHRGASLRDCAAANGVYNRAMLGLEHLAVDAPG